MSMQKGLWTIFIFPKEIKNVHFKNFNKVLISRAWSYTSELLLNCRKLLAERHRPNSIQQFAFGLEFTFSYNSLVHYYMIHPQKNYMPVDFWELYLLDMSNNLLNQPKTNQNGQQKIFSKKIILKISIFQLICGAIVMILHVRTIFT